MAGLVELTLPPDNSSYSVTDGIEVISAKLDGGASRRRRDIIGATSRVSVTWICDREDYEYLRMFYKAVAMGGANPFTIGLVLDNPSITKHKAYFVEGSMVLQQQKGLAYYVSAELEAYPLEMSTDAVEYVLMYNEFGNKWKTVALEYEAILDTVVNVEWPGVL